jgi:hypothetical protein
MNYTDLDLRTNHMRIHHYTLAGHLLLGCHSLTFLLKIANNKPCLGAKQHFSKATHGGSTAYRCYSNQEVVDMPKSRAQLRQCAPLRPKAERKFV